MALQKDFKNLIKFTITLGGLLSLFFITMFLTTGRNYFDHTIVSMAVNDVHPFEFIEGYGILLIGVAWGLILSFPVALFLIIKKSQYNVLIVYFLLYLVWTFYSAGKYKDN
jgi:hypothetical protein